MSSSDIIKENLNTIHQRMARAAANANRDVSEVRLLMATKTVEADRIKEAFDLGETLMGENKVQEYDQKWAYIKDLPIEKHFIGHLQTNKVKDVLKYVTCIQSVDRTDLADKIQQRLEFENKEIDIYVEVNTSGEESKSGIHPSNALALLTHMQSLSRIHVKGLMTIGLNSNEETAVRNCFKLLKQIGLDAAAAHLLPEKHELSMGMSHDLELAIEEGSTMIRVGSAIFGQRNYSL